MTLKKVTGAVGIHKDNHYGHNLLLECGHVEWRRGNKTPKRTHCHDCERIRPEPKETLDK